MTDRIKRIWDSVMALALAMDASAHDRLHLSFAQVNDRIVGLEERLAAVESCGQPKSPQESS